MRAYTRYFRVVTDNLVKLQVSIRFVNSLGKHDAILQRPPKSD